MYQFIFCFMKPRISTRYENSSLEDLDNLLKSGDSFEFFGKAVVFLQKKLIINGTHMLWNVTLDDRAELLKIFRDVSSPRF